MNLPVVITKESNPDLWAYLMAYMSMTAVSRAAADRALVPQNQGAYDALMFMESVRNEQLHEQLWSTVHEVFGTDPKVHYEFHASPDFKEFTLDLAVASSVKH